jgi:hypothetical protein
MAPAPYLDPASVAANCRLILRQLLLERLRQRSASVDTHLDRQDCSVLEHELHADVSLNLRRCRGSGQYIKRRCRGARRLFRLVQQRDGDGRGKFGRNGDIGCGPFGPLARRRHSSLGSRLRSPFWFLRNCRSRCFGHGSSTRRRDGNGTIRAETRRCPLPMRQRARCRSQPIPARPFRPTVCAIDLLPVRRRRVCCAKLDCCESRGQASELQPTSTEPMNTRTDSCSCGQLTATTSEDQSTRACRRRTLADCRRRLGAKPVGAFAAPGFPWPTFSVYEDRKHAWVGLPDNIDHMA